MSRGYWAVVCATDSE